MEAHQSAMDRAVQEALQQAELTPDKLDAIAVTQGPGLALCLRVCPTWLLCSFSTERQLSLHGEVLCPNIKSKVQQDCNAFSAASPHAD